MLTARSLYLSDFLTGVFAALAARGGPTLSLRKNRLDLAFGSLNADVLREAEGAGLDVKFRIRTHPVHGDSTQLQQAIYEAAQRDLISLDNPEFQRVRLKITADDAPAYLSRLPGPKEMYDRLAALLLRYYEEQGED